MPAPAHREAPTLPTGRGALEILQHSQQEQSRRMAWGQSVDAQDAALQKASTEAKDSNPAARTR
eukprot:7362043-Prymnesium_polylepis.2